MILKKSNHKIDRRHSADERQRGTNANTSNSVQTNNTPKSILKKPKKNPFSTSGRRKSMDARVNLNSVSVGSNGESLNRNDVLNSEDLNVTDSISFAPSSSVQSKSNKVNAQNLLSIRPSSAAQLTTNETNAQSLFSHRPSTSASSNIFRAIPSSTLVPNSSTSKIIRSNQNGFEIANSNKEKVSLVPSKYPNPFALQFRTTNSSIRSKEKNGKSNRSVGFKYMLCVLFIILCVTQKGGRLPALLPIGSTKSSTSSSSISQRGTAAAFIQKRIHDYEKQRAIMKNKKQL